MSEKVEKIFVGTACVNCKILKIMVRKLKFHEQKLLKKVDFINWQVDNNLHESKVLRKYHIRKREDYTK